MLYRWGLAGLVLWLVGTTTALVLNSFGIRKESIRLTLADGTPIHGVLYRPKDNTTPCPPRPAVVVLHGTAVTHQSCEPGLAMPFARSGFVVLAIDLRGHGRSGGRLPKSWFDDLDRILELQADEPEVVAALQYLKALPEVDSNRVSLVGHSLGGLAAVNAARSRDDVASVVSISVAPQLCDLHHPHNLLLLAGNLDWLMPRARFITAINRATDGAVSQPEVFSCSLGWGTGRELCIARWVSHVSQLFDPTSSRHAIQWVAYWVGYNPGPLPHASLIGTGSAVSLAVVAGALACTVLLKILTAGLLPLGVRTAEVKNRTGVALLFCALAAPVAAFLGGRLPTGGVLFAAPTVVLYAFLALIWLTAGRGAYGTTESEEPPTRLGLWRGVAVGLVSCLLGVVWLGLPLGATWLDLVPEGRRLTLGLILIPVLFPWSLALAHGLQRALPARGTWFQTARGFAWLAIPAAVGMGNGMFNGRYPFFGISVSLLAAAFLLPLPLWLLPDRRGMTLARAICQAGSAAWFLACHLAFVQG